MAYLPRLLEEALLKEASVSRQVYVLYLPCMRATQASDPTLVFRLEWKGSATCFV